MNKQNRHEFIDGYLDAMLWANCERDEMDTDPDRDALSWSALKNMVRDAVDFFRSQYTYLEEASESRPWDYLGHDFALNRAGHGTGFWDRGLGEIGDRLSKAALVCGDAYLYHDNDGRIYMEV